MRKIFMINCIQTHCTVYPAIIEDVVIDNLKCNEALLVHAPAFKHVVLQGRIGELSISKDHRLAISDRRKEQRLFEVANSEFYSDVDWALDLREAQFATRIDISGVPVNLIRRDPETQMVITREAALEGAWKSVDLTGTFWSAQIEWFMLEDEPACILIAPKLARNFKRQLYALQELRDVGVVM